MNKNIMKIIFTVILLCFMLSIISCKVTEKNIHNDETILNTEQLTENKRFHRYVSFGFILGKLHEYAKHMDTRLKVKSDEPYNITSNDVAITEPVEFPGKAKHPIKGAWFHRFSLTRGGEKRTYNLYFLSQKNKPPVPMGTIMGNTRASIILINDAIEHVYRVAYTESGLTPEEFKKTFMVIDSRVLAGPGPSGYWEEEWLVRAKDKNIPVLILFTPDKQGGHYLMVKVNKGETFLIENKK